MLDSKTILKFADAINSGRRAFGLPAVETWDITHSEPSACDACLSANHLIGPIELDVGGMPCNTDMYSVGTDFFGVDGRVRERLSDALGTEARGNDVRIPDAIRAVTDVFDAIGEQPSEAIDGILEVIRDDFIAAGLDAE